MRAALPSLVLLALLVSGAGWRELNSHQGKSTPPKSTGRFIRPLSGSLPDDCVPLVLAVEPESPAAALGLQLGDTLLGLDDVSFRDGSALREHLGQLPQRATVRIVCGTQFGRRDTTVRLRDAMPRLGITLPSTQISDTLVRIDDDRVTLAGYVSKWSDLTVIRIDVVNRGSTPYAFGPDSVWVTGGDAEVLVALTPEEVITLKYGGRVSDVAGSVPRSMADAIVGGAASGIAQGMRETTTKSVFSNALRHATIPPGARHGGALFIGRKNVVQPVNVHVSVLGRLYMMRFGQNAQD